jgi:hypothetical protein
MTSRLVDLAGEKGVVMDATTNVSEIRFDCDELARLALLARKLYEANTHIFEDERDALAALGVSADELFVLRPAA